MGSPATPAADPAPDPALGRHPERVSLPRDQPASATGPGPAREPTCWISAMKCGEDFLGTLAAGGARAQTEPLRPGCPATAAAGYTGATDPARACPRPRGGRRWPRTPAGPDAVQLPAGRGGRWPAGRVAAWAGCRQTKGWSQAARSTHRCAVQHRVLPGESNIAGTRPRPQAARRPGRGTAWWCTESARLRGWCRPAPHRAIRARLRVDRGGARSAARRARTRRGGRR